MSRKKGMIPVKRMISAPQISEEPRRGRGRPPKFGGRMEQNIGVRLDDESGRALRAAALPGETASDAARRLIRESLGLA